MAAKNCGCIATKSSCPNTDIPAANFKSYCHWVAKSPSELYSEILGSVFKEARERAGLSQKRLADLSGVGRTGIVTMEAGQRLPSVLIVQMLADALKVSLSSLIEEVEKRRTALRGTAGQMRRQTD